MLDFEKVEAGFARGSPLIPSRMIEWLDGHYSHCYWKFTLKNGMILLYEAHYDGGVQITPYEHFLEAVKDRTIEDYQEIPIVCDPDALWNECVKYHGDPYDVGQIVRCFIWIKYQHARGKKVLRLYCDGKFTCNEFMVETGRLIVRDWEKLDYSFTPNRLFKFLNGKQDIPKVGTLADAISKGRLDFKLA